MVHYESMLGDGATFFGNPAVNDVERFTRNCDVIATNRYDSILDDVKENVY